MCRIRGTDEHDLYGWANGAGDISASCVEWGRAFHLNGILAGIRAFPTNVLRLTSKANVVDSSHALCTF